MFNLVNHSYTEYKHHNNVNDTNNNEKTVSPLQWILHKHHALLWLLNKQSRWQLWLSEYPMLDKHIINLSGLTANKVIYHSHTQSMFAVIEKALKSGNISYIAACTNRLSTNQINYLRHLANSKGTHLFIVHENYLNWTEALKSSSSTEKSLYH